MKKKKGFLFLSSLVTISMLAGCNNKKKTAEIAVVTDVGSLNDGGFNQGTFEGAKAFATENNKTYNYYMPSGQNNATDADRENAMNLAIENGAKIVIAPGFLQASAMRKCAMQHPNVKFVFMDGFLLEDDNHKILNNVTAINYREEEAGFLAGYAVLKEGKYKLGGMFGGGGGNRACNAFAYGYVQGINQAVIDLEKENKEIPGKGKVSKPIAQISFMYGAQFGASPELKNQASSWYMNVKNNEDLEKEVGGTQIIFACGGSMTLSVKSAMDEYEKAEMVGVDVDQSHMSEKIITSATKNLASSVKDTLRLFYGNEWDKKLGGKIFTLGAKENAVGLPTEVYEKDNKKIDPWRFKNFTKEEYKILFKRIRGEGEKAEDNITTKTVDSKVNCDTEIFWKNVNEKDTPKINIRHIK